MGKNHLLRCWGFTFSSKLDLCSYIISIAKLPSRKLDSWFILRSFFLLTYLSFLSTIQPCIEYYCYVWAGASSCYLKLLGKLQKWIPRTVDCSLADSLELLVHRQHLARLSLFCRYYFGRCSSELVQLVPLPYSWRRSTRFWKDCMISFDLLYKWL